MFCVPEKEQAHMYFNVHCFVPDRATFKEVNGKPVLAITDFDGERHYTVVKNSRGIDLNPENWKKNSFFLTRNGVIMHNNFETLAEAQKAVDMYGKMAVDTAKTRGLTISPSHRPTPHIPEVLEPVIQEEAPVIDTTSTPEELITGFTAEPEEPLFTDDVIVEAPAEPATPSIADEIKMSLADALSVTQPATPVTEPESPLAQFEFRDSSFYGELTDEQKQQVQDNIVPAFATLQ
jgi:hypothetical protein